MSSSSNSPPPHENYAKVCTVLKWIKITYILVIFAIVADLKFKTIAVKPNRILITHYSRKQFGEAEIIHWSAAGDWRMQIVAKGEERFTNYTGHYTL
jgi:hypothetical protein